MNKRLLCLLLAVLLLLGCTACGQRAEPPAVAPSEAPAVEETPAPTEEPAPTAEPEAAEKLIRVFELDSGKIFGKAGEGFQRINTTCPRSILKEALDRIANVI